MDYLTEEYKIIIAAILLVFITLVKSVTIIHLSSVSFKFK